MSDQFSPLTDKELDQLGTILLSRIGEDTDTSGKDEGIFDMSTLDGYFTAIISGPQMIMPSQWLPAMWGDFEPDWDAKTYEKVIALLMRHMSSIAEHLMHESQSFEPLFFANKREGETLTIVDEWCYGYMMGVELCKDQWQLESLDMTILLTPVRMFGTQEGWEKLAMLNETETENIRKAITPNIQQIYAYWLARRVNDVEKTPFINETARVGRNDPCPCGSGKKYKKCCLH